MSKEFTIDKKLLDDSVLVEELHLSSLMLVNNKLFPWVLLVPRISRAREIIDLCKEDQVTLLEEITLVSKMMKTVFNPYKLNIAALGNVVEQLHIHIIARYKEDDAWPAPVFGMNKLLYNPSDIENITNLLRRELASQTRE